ncbi:molybdenum cofactor synthesis protein cinnamon [Chironomus tepperi]|uniref:molybdenum cofactor synthesis protein cinnamon n=1 Tax=Chironomus tepperi TaxID=113505 RepID=UPI00391FAA90
MVDFSYGVITVSDTCHRGEAIDKSGPKIKMLLQNYFNAFKISQSTVPDEIVEIEKMLLYYSDILKLNCIITTGGTGCAPRDVTPEATKRVIIREFPQLATLMLMEGLRNTRFAALTRGVCGIRGQTLILNFPGSVKACTECFDAVRELLPHAMELICDMKNKTKETHQIIQDVKPVDGPPAYFEIARTEEKEKEVEGKPGSDEVSSSISKSVADSSNDSKVGLYKALSSTTSSQSKYTDFSEFLPQSSTFLGDAILGGVTDKSEDSISTSSTISASTAQAVPQTASGSARRKSLIEKQPDPVPSTPPRHVCPHKTANPSDETDRNSPYPMIDVGKALDIIFDKVALISKPVTYKSPINCPPFRASIKDGYAMKSSSNSPFRRVIGFVNAGDKIIKTDFGADECYKINTGAPIPEYADCVIQIEDTKLMSKKDDGTENEIEINTFPKKNLDIRSIGADLMLNELMFTTSGIMDVAEKTFLASVGLSYSQKMPKIAIISTGDELVEPTSGDLPEGKIYDSNTTMLKLLCQKYGFEVKYTRIAKDDYSSLKSVVEAAMKDCQVIISSGGVSMGDKDFVKPLLKDLGFHIHFGRVNVKPGKPMTFASNGTGTSVFALPGNPVSAFVTFHIFVLPALRFMSGFSKTKSVLPTISVILQDSKYELDPRPEYVRATISYNNKTGLYGAQITSNQMSSRVASLIHADVLLQLPAASEIQNGVIGKGWKLKACVIDQFFVTSVVD